MTVGDVHILDVGGQLTLGEATKPIRYTIDDLLENGGNKIVLNLTDANYVDSSGIGDLVRTYTTVKKEGRSGSPPVCRQGSSRQEKKLR